MFKKLVCILFLPCISQCRYQTLNILGHNSQPTYRLLLLCNNTADNTYLLVRDICEAPWLTISPQSVLTWHYVRTVIFITQYSRVSSERHGVVLIAPLMVGEDARVFYMSHQWLCTYNNSGCYSRNQLVWVLCI